MKPSNLAALGIVLTFVLLSAGLGLYWDANRYEYMRVGSIGLPLRINRFTQKTEMWNPDRGWQTRRQ